MTPTSSLAASEHDAYLRAILDRPDDDVPRLLYADWLEKQGDPRGEFIHLQYKLRRLAEDDQERRTIEARQQQLLSKHQAKWLGPLAALAGKALGWQFRYGFVEAGELPVRTFLEHAETIFQNAPLRAIRLFFLYGPGSVLEESRHESPEVYQEQLEWLKDAGGATVEELVACRYLARLRRLDLNCWYAGDPAVVAVATCPHLVNLTALQLGNRNLGPAAVQAIGQSPYLTNLNTLDLSYEEGRERETNRIGDEGTEVLASSPAFGRLTTLVAQRCGIKAAGVHALVESEYLGRLSRLNLSVNWIGLEGLRAITESPRGRRFTLLNLAGCRLGPAAASLLASSPNVTSLTYLDLRNNDLSSENARELAHSPQLARLTVLDLSHNPIGNAGAKALAASPHWQRMVRLRIKDGQVGDEGRRALRSRFGERFQE